MIQLPPPDLTERLAAIDDPVLAAHLKREHPALFETPQLQTARGIRAWATRRFALPALAAVGALSIVAGAVLAPFGAHHRPAPAAAPIVVVPAAPAVRSAARRAPHRAAVAPHHDTVVAPTHRPAALAVPAVVAAPAAVGVAAPVSQPHLRPHPHLVPAAHPAFAPAARTAPVAEPAPARAPEPARREALATGAAEAPVAVAAPAFARSDADVAADSARGRYDVAAPDPNAGLKAPPITGSIESAAGSNPVSAPADPCSPRGGRIGAILGSLAR